MEVHRRRNTNRLVWHDYALPGEYFVTVCTKDREDLLGEIIGGEMRLNDVGGVVEKCWKENPQRFSKGKKVDGRPRYERGPPRTFKGENCVL